MMILMSPVSCTFNFFFFLLHLFLNTYCHLTNQIRLMMILTNQGLTPDPPVRTLFKIFLCNFTSPLLVLVFWGMTFLHQQELSPKVVESLYYFSDQLPDFPSKFQNQFYSFSLTLCSQRLQPLQFLQEYDPGRSNVQHVQAFQIFQQGSRDWRLYPVLQWQRSPNLCFVVLG